MKKNRHEALSASDSRRGLSRADAERLLSGAGLKEEGLGPLPSAIEIIRSVGENAPDEMEAQRFGVVAAKLVPAAPPRQTSRASSGHGAGIRRRRLALRLAGAAAALALMISASAGVAYAANGAVPGDTLYGLDRALEDVGLGDGGLEERLTEASRLVERGRVQEGLVFASDEILGAADGDQALRAAAMALRGVADGLNDDQDTLTPEELGRVAERLRLLASAGPTAKEFGQGVLDLAGSVSPQGQNGGGSGQPEGGSDPDAGNGQPGTTAPTGGNGGSSSGGGSGSGGNGSGGIGSGSPR